MKKYSWKMLFEDFKKVYPNKWRKGTSYHPGGFMTLLIIIPGDGKYKYEYFGKKLTLIEKFLTKNQMKYLKIFEREERMRDISKIMMDNKISQKKLSDLCGISRQSINYYITGNKTPKASTINKIYKALKENGYI